MLPGVALAAVSSGWLFRFLLGPPIIGFISEATNLRFSFALVAILGLGTTSADAWPKDQATIFGLIFTTYANETAGRSKTICKGCNQKHFFYTVVPIVMRSHE